MKPGATLTNTVSAEIISVTLDNQKAPLSVVSEKNIAHRMGVGVRPCRR